MTAIPQGGAINGVSYDDIANSATCQIFAAGAGLAATIAVGSAITGQIWGVVGGGAGLLAANALAAANGCFPANPDNGPGSGGQGNITPGSCLETVGCDLLLRDNEGRQFGPGICQKLLSVDSADPYPNGSPRVVYSWVDCDGVTQSADAGADRMPVTTEVAEGGECVGDPEPDPGPVLPDPVPVPDPDGGPCTFVTQIKDAYINAAGGMSILYETCATGGPGCSGCSRFWYHGPGNTQPAPPEPIPGPDGEPAPQPPPDGGGPGGNCPDPCEPCRFEPCEQPTAQISQREFEFTAPCDVNEDGSAAQVLYTLEGASTLGDCFEALASQNQQIMQLLQQHLNWKTPTCAPERPKLEGDFRTIHFVSDEKTVDGGTRLRKRFRYRSTSGESLGPIVDHWRDFVWQAGPVCVQHAGSSWGTPQIWAASADEGKRVIRHAAGEAGIDPDQNGRWIVGGSNSSRLGMPGTMRVSTRGGVYRITARDGSDGPPMVAIKQYHP